MAATYECKRCGHKWTARTGRRPVSCANPRCRNISWDTEPRYRKDGTWKRLRIVCGGPGCGKLFFRRRREQLFCGLDCANRAIVERTTDEIDAGEREQYRGRKPAKKRQAI